MFFKSFGLISSENDSSAEYVTGALSGENSTSPTTTTRKMMTTTTTATATLFMSENQTTECTNSYCMSDADYLLLIHDFIFPTSFEWVLIGLYFVVFVVGIVGNFLVCFVVWSDLKMRSVTNLFIVNLSVADFLVLLVCLPTTVLGDVTETWYMGSAMCKVVQYLQV